MRYLVQFQVNVFSFWILIGLYMFIRMTKVKSFSKGIIKLLILAVGVSIVVEPLTWIFDSEHFFGAYYLEYFTNFLLVLMAPVIGGLMISYVDFYIHKNSSRIINRLYYQHITLLTFVILIINIYTPIYFDVNKVTHAYIGGPYYVIHYILFYSLYLFLLYLTARSYKKISSKETLIFLFSFLIPLVGSLIQMYESKFYLSWSSVVFVLLVLYLFLETSPVEEDHLTKTYNRESLITHVGNLIQNHKDFGIVMLDLNDFKAINDQYGHKEGDDVLIAFSKSLKEIFKENGFVARLGGDEFCVVTPLSADRVAVYLEGVQTKLRMNEDEVIQKLTFSYGYQNYELNMSLDALYIGADKKMYQQKKEKKCSA